MKKIFQFLLALIVISSVSVLANARSANNISVSIVSGTATQGVASELTYDVTLTRSDSSASLNLPLTVSGLPIGATVSFVTDTYPYPVVFSTETTVAHATLKLSLDGTTPSNSYQITLSAENFSNGTVNLTVAPICLITTPGCPGYIDTTLPGDTGPMIPTTPTKAPQTITFPEITSPQNVGNYVRLRATSDAGLSVTYSASGSCSIDVTNVSQLNFDSIGGCLVTASQSGNSSYSAAADVSQEISVEDNDGVDNETEDAGPNNGDGNEDGIKDSEQQNVVSAPDFNLDKSGYVTLEVAGNVGTPEIKNFSTHSTKGLKITDGSTAPVGGFAFTASGGFEGVLNVRIILDKVYDTSNWSLKKTVDESGVLVDGPEATFDTVTIDGVDKTRISYSIKDGGPFDADGANNGSITDPVFPIIPPVVTPAPTTTTSGGSIVIPSASYSYGSTQNLYSTTNTTVPSPNMPQVLGASTTCGVYMNLNGDYLAAGHKNNSEQVILLKKFLNKNLGINLEINSNYDLKTEEAVKKFQTKYKRTILNPWGIADSTGIVYLTTVAEINYLECPTLGFSVPKDLLIPIDHKKGM